MGDSLRAIFFDWDGTMADTALRARNAFAAAFEELGVGFDDALYERSYSPDWTAVYAAFGIDKSRWEETNLAWRRHFGASPPVLVAGARSAVEGLHRAGVRVGIVTSAHRERITLELHQANITEFVDVVVSGDDVTRKKPATDALLRALELSGVGPSEAWYVGDSPEDLQMAVSCGVTPIGVASSYPSNALVMRSESACIRITIGVLSALVAGVGKDLPRMVEQSATRLVVYGSLCPGRENHHVLASVGGAWTRVHVLGTLLDRGWGARTGFPGIVLRGDDRVDAFSLQSKALPDHWNRLDEFEGIDYVRQICVAHGDQGIVAANIYALR